MTDGQPQDLFDNVPVARPIPVARGIDGPSGPGFLLAPHDIQPERIPLLLERSTRKEAAIDIALCLILLLLCELACGGLIYVVLGNVDDQTYMLPTVIVRTIYCALIVTTVLRKRSQTVKSVGIVADDLGVNLSLGMVTPIFMMGMVLSIMWSIWFFWPALGDEMQANAETIMTLIPKLSPIGFLFLTAMVGFYEELIFRGFLMTRLRRATGSWTLSVVLSTLAFVSLHTDQVSIALVPVTILSLTFSLVTIWRKSLIPAIVAHLLWNLGQFLFLSLRAGDAWN